MFFATTEIFGKKCILPWTFSNYYNYNIFKRRITCVPGLPHSTITHLSVKLGEGGITCTVHPTPWRERALRGWGHCLPLTGAITPTRKLPSKSTTILRGWTFEEKTSLICPFQQWKETLNWSFFFILFCCCMNLRVPRPLLALMERPGSGLVLLIDGMLTEPPSTPRLSWDRTFCTEHLGDQNALIYIYLLLMSKTNML